MSDGLTVDGLVSYYGDFQALHGISLRLEPGQVFARIGANGAGKSTLLKSICGLVTAHSGSVTWRGKTMTGLPASATVAQGIALVPEGRRLFKFLSVEENLILGGQVNRPGPWSLRTLYDLFPILHEKRHQPATSLSGRQQQMVAIGRALMSNPDLILLDELSLALPRSSSRTSMPNRPASLARGRAPSSSNKTSPAPSPPPSNSCALSKAAYRCPASPQITAATPFPPHISEPEWTS